jgi:hypothetical protein
MLLPVAGCTYVVTAPDTNPASHYHRLPAGCKLSNGIGVVVLLVAVCVALGMMTNVHPSRDDVNSVSAATRSSYTNLDLIEREA